LKTVFAAEIKRSVGVLPLMLSVFGDMHPTYWVGECSLGAWMIPLIILMMTITLFLCHGSVRQSFRERQLGRATASKRP
jgi:cytochrome c oxidase assembly factor CtaG